MDPANREIAHALREQVKALRSDELVKLESERSLEKRLGAGRQRIRAVIQQLMSEGLLVKQAAKGTYITPVVRDKSLNLVCSPDIKHNDPFYNNLLVELTNFAAKESVNISPLTPGRLHQGFRNSPVLVIGRMEDGALRTLRDAFPTIIAFENYAEHDFVNQIYFDHYRIGWNGAKALAEHGHARALHLTGPGMYAAARQRKSGFLDAARKYGVGHEIISEKMNFQGGYRAGPAAMELVRGGGCTAVFAANDWMAVGLMQFLKENGLRIPDDVSLIAVDDIPLASQISPSLTTFSLDARMMVAEVFVLLNAMQATENAGRRVVLTPILVARESLAAPARKRESIDGTELKLQTVPQNLCG